MRYLLGAGAAARIWPAVRGIVGSVMAYFLVKDVTDSVDNVTIPAMSGFNQDKPDEPLTAGEQFGKTFGMGFAILLLIVCWTAIKGAAKALKF